MGSRFIKPPKPKVDCSGLVSDILRRAWFSVWDQTSRSLFTKFNAKKLSDISNQSVDSQNFSKIQPGDLIYWDATNPSYNWKSSKIPIINVGWQKHRIHHVAIITEKLSNGNLRILESSWTKGVVERELDPKVEFSTKSKSELYVSHMRYDALPVKKEALA
jgi:cell wall-associated NlpC family hydrolase